MYGFSINLAHHHTKILYQNPLSIYTDEIFIASGWPIVCNGETLVVSRRQPYVKEDSRSLCTNIGSTFYNRRSRQSVPKKMGGETGASGNSQNSSRLPTLFGSFELAGKTRVHLAPPHTTT